MAKNFHKLRETNDPFIQQLENAMKDKDTKFANRRSKVVESVERLKILHDIFLEHAFSCKAFDVVFFEYEAIFPPPPNPGDEIGTQKGGEQVVAWATRKQIMLMSVRASLDMCLCFNSLKNSIYFCDMENNSFTLATFDGRHR